MISWQSYHPYIFHFMSLKKKKSTIHSCHVCKSEKEDKAYYFLVSNVNDKEKERADMPWCVHSFSKSFLEQLAKKQAIQELRYEENHMNICLIFTDFPGILLN